MVKSIQQLRLVQLMLGKHPFVTIHQSQKSVLKFKRLSVNFVVSKRFLSLQTEQFWQSLPQGTAALVPDSDTLRTLLLHECFN